MSGVKGGSEELQKVSLIALTHDPYLLAKCMNEITEDFFPHPPYKLIYRSLKTYYDKYMSLPSKDELRLILQDLHSTEYGKLDVCLEEATEVFDAKISSEDFVYSAITDFIRRYKVENAMREIADSINGGEVDLDKTAVSLRDSLMINFSKAPVFQLSNVSGIKEIREEVLGSTDSSLIIKSFVEPINWCMQYKGLIPGTVNMVVAPPGRGKALPIFTNIVTPSGYTKIGNARVGDLVAGTDGKFHTVLGVFPQGKKKVYEVHFSDGSVVECCNEHLWTYQTNDQRKRSHRWNTKTLQEIIDTVPMYYENKGFKQWNIYVPNTDPVEFLGSSTHKLEPYALGVFIGDGCSCNNMRISNSEDDVLAKFESSLTKLGDSMSYVRGVDYRIVGGNLKSILIDMGLYGKKSYEKFIPKEYLFSSIENRFNLLMGLIDSDGYCKGSSYEFSTTSKHLCEDMKFLIQSLGMTATCSINPTHYLKNGERVDCRDSYRLSIKPSKEFPKLHSSKKHDNRWTKGQSVARRTIRKIVETSREEEMVCIQVDSKDHLFLVENFIPTHNTTFLINQGVSCAQQGFNILHVFLGDMSKFDGLIRYLSCYTGKNTSDLVNLSPEELEMFVKKWNMTGILGNIFIASYAADELSASQLVEEIVAIQKDNRVHFHAIIIDYDENLSKDVDSIYESGGNVYNKIALFAVTNRSVVFIAAQPKPEFWGKEIIPLEAAAESSKKQKIIDLMLTIGKPTKDSSIGTLNIAKNRRGEDGKLVRLKFNGAAAKVECITEEKYSEIKSKERFQDRKASENEEKK